MFIAASRLHSSAAQIKESGGVVGGEVKRCRGGDEGDCFHGGPSVCDSGPWVIEGRGE